MKKESDRTQHENILMDYNSPWDSVLPNNSATNNFISGLGIIFNHYKAIPNPVYEANIGDMRRTFPEEFNQDPNNPQFDFVEDGFLYKYAGQVWGIMQGNNKRFADLAGSLYAKAGAFVTFNRYYRGTDEYASFAEYDKLIPCVSGKEFFSVNWEKLTSNNTGINRLQFPACEVEYLVDNRGVEYFANKDFALENGYIKWLSLSNSNRPGIDPATGRGRVVSIRYKYKPTFYVQFLAHDMRIHATLNEMGELVNGLETLPDGSIQYKSGPPAVNIVADFVFLDRRTNEPDQVDSQLETQEDGDNVGPR